MLVSGFFDGVYMGQDENGAIYDRNYQAEFFARYFSSFVSNGVFNKNVDSFKVVPLDGRNIVVKSGSCFINGYFGFEKKHNELILDENINSNSRIDRIILRLDLSSRDITIQVLKGEEAEEPTPKELNRSGDIYEIALADITISSNLENITNKNIKDLRENNDLCGYVNHTLEEVDQNIFYNQIFKYLRKSRIKEKDDFKKWFEDIKSILNTNTVSKHIVKSVFSESGVHNFRYNINTNKFEKFNNDTQEFEKIKLGSDTTLKKTPKIIIKGFKKRITISWKDSEDITVKGEIVRRWKGTILVKKIGSPPLSYDDGEILVNNTERNKYLNAPFVDENIESNTEYYYGVFPYDDEGNYNVNIQNIVHGHEVILDEMIFSFIVHLSESNPLNNITYADDSEGYTDPESWDNCPLFQAIKPCLLKDGVVQYYLNVDNYDLKEDGTPSNLNGDDGNVMVEFPSIIYKIEPFGEDAYKCSISTNLEKYKNDNTWIKSHLEYSYNKYSKKIYISCFICETQNENFSSKKTNKTLLELTKNTINEIYNKFQNSNTNDFLLYQGKVKLLFLLGFLRFKTTQLQKIFNVDWFNALNIPEEKRYRIGSLTTGGLFSGCGSETPQEAIKFFGIEIPKTATNYILLGGLEADEYRTTSGNFTNITNYLFLIKNYFYKTNFNKNIKDIYENNKTNINKIHENTASYYAPYGGSVINEFSSKKCNDFKIYENYGYMNRFEEKLKEYESTNNTYLTINNNIFSGTVRPNDYLNRRLCSILFLTNSKDFLYTTFVADKGTQFNFYYMYLPPNEE